MRHSGDSTPTQIMVICGVICPVGSNADNLYFTVEFFKGLQMSKIQTIARALAPAIAIAAALTCGGGANAASLSEGFDNISLWGSGSWTQKNNSTAPGDQPNWMQGEDGFPFAQHQGGVDGTSYITVDYRSTEDLAGKDTISNWLISPTLTFRNNDVVSFFTRTEVRNDPYADRLELRFSNVGGTNVGTSPLDVGTFTTLLRSVNPGLVANGYPQQWTGYTSTITGLSGPTNGAIAFRYFVTNGGPGGVNSNVIGLDTVSIAAGQAPAPAVPEPAAYLMMALGLGVIGLRRMRATRV